MVRLSTILTMAATASGLASAQVDQVVDGHTFVTSGPAIAAHWHEYWFNTSATALHTLKTLLGPQALKDLLKPEIEKGDVFWRDIVARSSGKEWKAASGRTLAFLPNVTAQAFAMWFASPLADLANNDANAEHYYKQTVADPATGGLSSEIIEGWGGVVTHFTIPNFKPVNQHNYDMLDELPNFPIQFAGDKVLLDGTIFGILHIAVRDITGADFPEHADKGSGIEIYAAVWYGDASEEEHLEQERQHMIIEEINLSRQAQKDIVAGLLPMPSRA
ncbi:hypothetical protein PspLS_01022 [Pyricularia sp. CBS 133598]|nr:hypothetical protein PspLS_01022 [Pyricularia sp. CBS 133598]